MRREKIKRQSRPISRSAKIVVSVLLGVIALAVVFAVLSVTRQKIAYREASEDANEILMSRGVIEGFLDKEVDSLELDDESQQAINEFETALTKIDSYMKSLSASTALKDEQIKEKYEQIVVSKAKIDQLNRVWQDVKLLLDLTDENLERLKKSDSEYLRILAEELSEYRVEYKAFQAKYGENASTSGDLIEEYGKIQLIGDGLQKKYADVKLDDILGMSRDDILSFYATIEELNDLLNKKK